jgi:CheY-specific phosphatase CheX
LETFEADSEGGQPVIGEIHLLEPFIAATRAAVAEMADTEVGVRGMVRKAMRHALGDIAAIISLSRKNPKIEKQTLEVRKEPSPSSSSLTPNPWPSASSGFLILSFPQMTATALARRILTGVTAEVDQKLISDCMGEIANVVTGQAKAMLVETPYRFLFTLPPVVVDAKEFQPSPCLDCLMVTFTCDEGEFALQLSLDF